MRPICFASGQTISAAVSEGGTNGRKEWTSLVFWIEVDVAAHDLVKEGLGSVGGGPGSLEGVCDDIRSRWLGRTGVGVRVRVAGHGDGDAGHGEGDICACLANLDHEERCGERRARSA